jgi:hypothetical protein
MAIISLLIGILLPALLGARRATKMTKDGAQIREIHQAWIVAAREFNGAFPTPGLINRQPLPGGANEPGRGAENKLLNDTARVHAASIMANYYSAEIVVGTTEPSGHVSVKDDYNYELFNAPADVYWDDSFKTDLNGVCNTSYASMPVARDRQVRQWRDTADSTWPMIGNRGVQNGSLTASIYNSSITLQIHSKKQWLGNIVFNDNHVLVSKTFVPEGVEFDLNGAMTPDNIFKNDSPGGGPTSPAGIDAWLCIIRNGGMVGTPDFVQAMLPTWD